MVQSRNRKTRGRGRKNRGRKTRGRKTRGRKQRGGGGSTFLGRLFTPNQARAADEAEAAKAAAAAEAAAAAKVAAAEAARVAAEEAIKKSKSLVKFRDSTILPVYFEALKAKLKEENKTIDSLAQKWLESNAETRGQPEEFNGTQFTFVETERIENQLQVLLVYNFTPNETELYGQTNITAYLTLAHKYKEPIYTNW